MCGLWIYYKCFNGIRWNISEKNYLNIECIFIDVLFYEW